jgi:hypothetical protein
LHENPQNVIANFRVDDGFDPLRRTSNGIGYHVARDPPESSGAEQALVRLNFATGGGTKTFQTDSKRNVFRSGGGAKNSNHPGLWFYKIDVRDRKPRMRCRKSPSNSYITSICFFGTGRALTETKTTSGVAEANDKWKRECTDNAHLRVRSGKISQRRKFISRVGTWLRRDQS